MPDSTADAREPWDCLVIGGGPAGLTAAVYLRRFHRRCLVVDAGESRARWIPESHNCPGFPHGIGGLRLLQRLGDQAAHYGVPIVRQRVTAIEIGDGEGYVVRSDAARWRARSLILATGIADQLPPHAWAEAAIAARALRLCAVCDAYEATDQRIGVYGPRASIEAHARFLATFSREIVLLPSDDDTTGALRFDGTHVVHEAADGVTTTFDAVYACLGSTTAAHLLTRHGARVTREGELEVDRFQMTTLPDVYAIGDIVSGLNQIAVAFGQAAVAACHLHATLPAHPRETPAVTRGASPTGSPSKVRVG